MNLDELQNPMSAASLAQLLKKHHGITLPINQLTEEKSKKMLKKVRSKLKEFRNSPKSHVAETNENYNALILIEQALQVKLDEAPWSIEDFMKPKTPMDRLINLGDKLAGLKRHVPGMDKHDYDAADGPLDILKYQRGVGVKIQLDDQQITLADRNSTKVGLAKINDLLDDYSSGYVSSTADYQTLAKVFAYAAVKKIYSSSQINQIAKNFRTTSAQILTLCQKVLNPGGGATINDYKLLAKYFSRSQSTGITESRRRLSESAMADAEVVLAAKDIADRFQDMVESLGKMINEEMPALVETIRDTMGAEQADAYNSSATQTINSALENIRTAKEALDSAARTLAGEETGAQPMDELGGEETLDTAADELDQIPSAASGGDEEPLGRGER